MRKPAFCICENKDADQLCGNRTSDQRLCFRYIDSTPLFYLNKKISASIHLLRLQSPVCVGPGRKPRRQVFSRRGSIIIHRAHSNVSVEYGGNGKVSNNTNEDNTLQATSSRFSLFHLFTMQQHKINAKSTGLSI